MTYEYDKEKELTKNKKRNIFHGIADYCGIFASTDIFGYLNEP